MILKKNTIEFENYLKDIDELKKSDLFFTDTHAHIHFDDFKNNEYVRDCKNNAVRRIVTVGIDLNDSKKALDLALQFEGIYSTCGVHPHDAKDFSVKQLDDFEKLIQNKKVIAVGEIGLDYYRNLSDKDTQKNIFLTFLDLAIFHKKPIVIHNRDASDDLISVMENVISNQFYGGIIHCFSGDKKLLKWALDKGFYISYAGPLTYSKASDLRETVKFVPDDRLFIETDCPYLTPMPFRGKQNDPSKVIFTAYTLSKLKNIDIYSLVIQLEKNFEALFGKLNYLDNK